MLSHDIREYQGRMWKKPNKKPKQKVKGRLFCPAVMNGRKINGKSFKRTIRDFWRESASLPAGRQGNCILAIATRSLERNSENANRSRRQKIPCAKKLLLLLRKSIFAPNFLIPAPVSTSAQKIPAQYSGEIRSYAVSLSICRPKGAINDPT